MNSANETKVTKVNIAPKWMDVWKIWLRIGEIDKDTYDIFLPAMIALDKQNDKIEKENQS